MRIIILLLTVFCTHTATAQLSGTWYAVLDAGGQQIPLNVEFIAADSGYAGTLQSPTQTEVRMPLSSVIVTGDSLHFELNTLALQYAGILSGDTLLGTFQQSGFSAPLVFYRNPPGGYAGDVGARAVRPQEPTDFPYRRETVTFPGGDSSVVLAGELTQPTDTLPKALLVLISGSGPQDRNEDLGPQINHRPFLVLSDYLTRRGYGVLRYDDRGVGESTGNFGAATSADFAADARAAVRYLRSRGELVSVPVGVLGHSEGGMIAPMVAAEGGVDFIILLAAPGHPIDSLLSDQRRQLSDGAPPYDLVHRAAYAYIKAHQGEDTDNFRRGLMEALTVAEQSMVTDPVASDLVETYATPWMRYFVAFDPAKYLERVTVPVLAINGELDRQVAVSNLAAIATALKRGGNEDYTLTAAPKLNHLLQPAETGGLEEYGKIELTIDPGVLQEIGHWLDRRF